MSCVSALCSQIATLLSVPHEVLLLRHKVFREYAKVAVGPDFIHTLPSVLIMTAAALFLWKYPPFLTRFLELVHATFVYRGLQVSVSCLAINALLWLWLILQRILYCSVWYYWSYECEYRDITYPWWQRVWSSYYPPRAQPPVTSASFISWIIAMLIAVTALGCAIFADRITTTVGETLTKARDALATVVTYCTSYLWERIWQIIVGYEEVQDEIEQSSSTMADDRRSEIESSTDAGSVVARGDIHPISYGTNWMPQPNFSMFKEPQRNLSMKSFHTVAGANDFQDADKFMAKQMRHRRGCHTVIPNNPGEQSSDC